MIHNFPLQCYPKLGTQPNLIQYKRCHIYFSFSLRENILIWTLHQNEPMYATYLFLITFDSSKILYFLLMLWTDVAVATWSGQVRQCFFGLPYIILIFAESTVLALFITLCSPPINLITPANRKENIPALIIIILGETWHYCQILLVSVDSSWNTRRRLC